MSLKQIPSIAQADLDTYASAEIGAESRVFLSYYNGLHVAELEQDTVNVGTLVLDNTFAPPVVGYAPNGGAGADMVVLCDGPVSSDAPIVITFGVTFVAGSAATLPFGPPASSSSSSSVGAGTMKGTAIATFRPPVTSQDQTNNFPPGLGVDLRPTGINVGDQILSVDTVVSITGGAAGNKFKIVALPDRSSMNEISCSTKKDVEMPSPKSVAIACRYDGARWVKRGRSEPPKLMLTAKHGSFGDGLARYNGHRITAMIEVWKDDRVLSERLFFVGWRPTVKVPKGDGDAEVEASAEGIYETFGAFI